MPAKLVRTDDALELNLSGHPEFKDALAKVKLVPGRRFDGERKVWQFPPEVDIAERLVYAIQPECSPDILAWIKEAKAVRAEELTTPLPPDAELKLHFASDLYRYQRSAVDFLAEHPKAILADEMGLGKTLQAISAVKEYCLRHNIDEGARPKLIVCPNSVKGVWARELKLWLGEFAKFIVVNGSSFDARRKQIQEGIETNAWIIVNWEQIRATFITDQKGKKHTALKEPLLGLTEWIAVIADEAHRAKNRKALVTQGLWQIHAPVQLALTGTPVLNSPDELWPILKWLVPEQYTSYWRFYDQYVDFYEGYYGKVITGVRNPDALRFELKTRLVRRTKSQELDLPKKTRQIIPVELTPTQRKLYKEAERKLWLEVEQAIEDGDKSAERFAKAATSAPALLYQIPNGAARTVRLRQIASSPALLGGPDDSAKLDACVEIITDAQPKQFVVFSEFVQTCNLLVERLQAKGLNAAAYTGEIESEERTKYENAFQAGDIDVLVGTIPAMREGISLHAANTVIFLERPWTPGYGEQCEDRLHRVGQKHNVSVLILEAQDTVDVSRIAPTNRVKELIVKSIIKTDEVETVV